MAIKDISKYCAFKGEDICIQLKYSGIPPLIFYIDGQEMIIEKHKGITRVYIKVKTLIEKYSKEADERTINMWKLLIEKAKPDLI